MATTQFCDRYRERNVANPRQMLALRNSKVDLSKWEPVSFGHAPPSKVKALAAHGFVIIEIAAQTIARTARRYRPSRNLLWMCSGLPNRLRLTNCLKWLARCLFCP